MLWGGKCSLIVPTDGKTILPVFWQLLEAFDPDYLYLYRKTGLDTKLSRPSEFAGWLQRELASWMARDPGEDRAAAEQRCDEALCRVQYTDPGISPELQEELKSRLSPFTNAQYAVGPGGITAAGTPQWPLTAVADLLPYCDHPTRVTSITVETQEVPALWAAAVSGCISESFDKLLQETGIEVVRLTIGKRQLWDLFEWVVTGEPYRLRREIARTIGSEDLAPEVPLNPFPFDLSMVNASFYSRLRFDDHKDPPAVVVGDTLSDFCLYYGLYRVWQRVVWLPQKWLKSANDPAGTTQAKERLRMLASCVYRLTDHGQREYLLHSLSCSPSELEEAREVLGRACGGGVGDQLSSLASVPDGIERCLVAPRRVYNNGQVRKDSLRHFVGAETPGPIETPKPAGFLTLDPQKHRWITEVAVQGHTFPRLHGLGCRIARIRSYSDYFVRCTSEGVAYFCPNPAVFGTDVDSLIVRPIIRVPPAVETFQFLLARAGFKHATSDKGRFTRDSLRKFGGLDALAKLARNPQSRAVFDRYVDKKRNERGVHDEGVYLQEEQRTFLDLAAMEKIWGDPEGASQFADTLVSRGVLARGLILKCQFCLNAAWFSPREVDRTFKCPRCRRKQVMTRAHWREPAEPKWYYKLDEIVYQGWSNNMVAPVLTLDVLSRSCKASFEYCEEQTVFRAGKRMQEVDVWCIRDGVVTIGESKTADRVEDTAKEEAETIQRYLGLAKAIEAAEVVFATMADKWADSTVQAVEKAFGGSHVKFSLLNNSQLLHFVNTGN